MRRFSSQREIVFFAQTFSKIFDFGHFFLSKMAIFQKGFARFFLFFDKGEFWVFLTFDGVIF